ncbi:MAG: hypothetical protein CMO81_06915 [Waddliaceae bacterium]|nr:hypothetical protein [Waddliaceae bacterium]
MSGVPLDQIIDYSLICKSSFILNTVRIDLSKDPAHIDWKAKSNLILNQTLASYELRSFTNYFLSKNSGTIEHDDWKCFDRSLPKLVDLSQISLPKADGRDLHLKIRDYLNSTHFKRSYMEVANSFYSLYENGMEVDDSDDISLCAVTAATTMYFAMQNLQSSMDRDLRISDKWTVRPLFMGSPDDLENKMWHSLCSGLFWLWISPGDFQHPEKEALRYGGHTLVLLKVVTSENTLLCYKIQSYLNEYLADKDPTYTESSMSPEAIENVIKFTQRSSKLSIWDQKTCELYQLMTGVSVSILEGYQPAPYSNAGNILGYFLPFQHSQGEE